MSLKNSSSNEELTYCQRPCFSSVNYEFAKYSYLLCVVMLMKSSQSFSPLKQLLGITIALLRYIGKFYLFVLQHYQLTSVFFRSARFRFISVCGVEH